MSTQVPVKPQTETQTKVKPQQVPVPVYPGDPGEQIDLCGNKSHGNWQQFHRIERPGYRLKVAPGDRFFERGVMLNVKLSAAMHTDGCGTGYYTGHAQGEFHDGKEWSVAGERHLGFDGYDGFFFDKETNKKLSQVSVLMLRDNCHAAYIL